MVNNMDNMNCVFFNTDGWACNPSCSLLFSVLKTTELAKHCKFILVLDCGCCVWSLSSDYCCRENLAHPSEVLGRLLIASYLCLVLLSHPNTVMTTMLQSSVTVATDPLKCLIFLTHLGVLTQTMPMWQKKMHSLSFWFSQEQRFSRRWAVWASCARGPSSTTVGLATEKAEAEENRWEGTYMCINRGFEKYPVCC